VPFTLWYKKIIVVGTKIFINCRSLQIIRKVTVYVASDSDIYMFFVA